VARSKRSGQQRTLVIWSNEKGIEVRRIIKCQEASILLKVIARLLNQALKGASILYKQLRCEICEKEQGIRYKS
jgi:hypothetical protein